MPLNLMTYIDGFRCFIRFINFQNRQISHSTQIPHILHQKYHQRLWAGQPIGVIMSKVMSMLSKVLRITSADSCMFFPTLLVFLDD